jgi:hypothetical protein
VITRANRTLPGILAPFLWLELVDEYEIHGTEGSFRVARVQGIAKGPETAPAAGALAALAGVGNQRLVDRLARAARETAYGQAEDAIAAALAAGYTLMRHPGIDMTGRISHDRSTGLDVPCAECRVDLHFRVPEGR